MERNGSIRIPKTISRHFEIPEGLIDLQYEQDEYIDGWDDAAEEIVDDTEIDDQAGDQPDVPTNFTITQLPVRFGPDGSQIVDLLIEVEDVPEISNYEVHVTKV
jgi:hypothetical protein